MILVALLLAACGHDKQDAAERLLERASRQAESGSYAAALATIDTLRSQYPRAIDARKRALRLYQEVALRQAQQELAVVDSVLQAVNGDYQRQKSSVERAKASLSVTAEALTQLTLARIRRDSIQTRHDVLCAKIRYIHKKQKEE